MIGGKCVFLGGSLDDLTLVVIVSRIMYLYIFFRIPQRILQRLKEISIPPARYVSKKFDPRDPLDVGHGM